jgi:hypothetical protein
LSSFSKRGRTDVENCGDWQLVFDRVKDLKDLKYLSPPMTGVSLVAGMDILDLSDPGFGRVWIG